jgi:hypothetical protein
MIDNRQIIVLFCIVKINEKIQDLSSVYFQTCTTLTYFKIIAIFNNDKIHIKRTSRLDERDFFFFYIQTSIDYLIQ